MNILGNVRRIPGGLMIVPMCITAVINTFFPQALQIGSVTTGTFTGKGTMAVIGIMLFLTGSQFRVHEIPKTLKRGGAICVLRLLIGFVIAWLVTRFFGLEGFWGISAAALGVTMVSCNPGVYMALMDHYGDGVDKAAFGLLNIIAVPAAPLFIMEAASGAGIDYMGTVSTLAPFLLGMLLGNLDENIRKMTGPALPIMLPFLGFCFGSAINLFAAVKSGLSGIILTIIYLVISVPLMYLLDRLVLHRPGYGAVATCSVAGIAVVVPMMLAQSNPAHLPYVEAATAQVALAVIFTSFLTPWITGFIAKRDLKKTTRRRPPKKISPYTHRATQNNAIAAGDFTHPAGLRHSKPKPRGPMHQQSAG